MAAVFSVLSMSLTAGAFEHSFPPVWEASSAKDKVKTEAEIKAEAKRAEDKRVEKETETEITGRYEDDLGSIPPGTIFVARTDILIPAGNNSENLSQRYDYNLDCHIGLGQQMDKDVIIAQGAQLLVTGSTSS